MKKCIAFVFALLLIACNEQPGYILSGTVEPPHTDGEYIYLYEYGIKDAAPLDSALVENGKFTFKGMQHEPTLAILHFEVPELATAPKPGEDHPHTVVFVLENGKLEALLNNMSTVTGTLENDAWSAFRKEVTTLRANSEQLIGEMKSEDAAMVATAEKEYDAMEEKVSETVTKYIVNNPGKLSAAKLLHDFRYSLSDETKGEALAKAGEKFKSVFGIDRMIEHQAILGKVAVGKKITDFEMADPDGKMHKLSDYTGNGKVVLIDFWASWCPPCRKEMPHLTALYAQYKNKNFEIVGISLDNNKTAWEKGIKDLNITWPQLSDLKQWKNEGAALYGVNSIPHTILVDKEGIILAKNIHGDVLDAKLAEILK